MKKLSPWPFRFYAAAMLYVLMLLTLSTQPLFWVVWPLFAVPIVVLVAAMLVAIVRAHTN